MTVTRPLRASALLCALALLAVAAPALPAAAATITSDDFSSTTLDTNLWRHLDPRGDTTLTMTGTNAVISIPAGVNHDLWTNRLYAPRLLQAAPDADFEVEVKFDSGVTAGQMQGLVVQHDDDDLLRFEVHHNGSAVKLYAASIVAGKGTTLASKKVVLGAPVFLRVTRAGSQWTLSYSSDGATWATGLTVTHTLAVTEVGVHAGTFGSSPPAFDASIDYFSTVGPSSPDDGGGDGDTTAPVLSSVAAAPAETFAVITWSTDETATSAVAYGPTTAYESGMVSDTNLVTSHSVTLAGLACETLYHYQASSTDAAGNLGSAPDATFATSACPSEGESPPSGSGPVIDVWYGDQQAFGQPGMAQQWVNLLGNVSDPDGVNSLSYSLNGGAWAPLTVGPDSKRLVAPGDFNAEIDHRTLAPGSNNVTLQAADTLGNETTRTVTVSYTAGQIWPLPYTTDWASRTRIGDAAQVVDGLWMMETSGVRTAQVGYDRLLALGDTTWPEYEVTVPVTINALRAGNGQAGVGVLVGWTGHTGKTQPRVGVNYGALAWYQRFGKESTPYRLQIRKKGTILAEDLTGRTLEPGVRYVFKFRMDVVASGTARYSLKVWEEGTPEPTGWDLIGDAGARAGSALLVAHHIDATFGDVTIIPLAE